MPGLSLPTSFQRIFWSHGHPGWLSTHSFLSASSTMRYLHFAIRRSALPIFSPLLLTCPWLPRSTPRCWPWFGLCSIPKWFMLWTTWIISCYRTSPPWPCQPISNRWYRLCRALAGYLMWRSNRWTHLTDLKYLYLTLYKALSSTVLLWDKLLSLPSHARAVLTQRKTFILAFMGVLGIMVTSYKALPYTQFDPMCLTTNTILSLVWWISNPVLK